MTVRLKTFIKIGAEVEVSVLNEWRAGVVEDIHSVTRYGISNYVIRVKYGDDQVIGTAQNWIRIKKEIKMDKLITVSVTYTLKVHPTSQEPGRGRFELINSDGVRECWCNSVSEAEEYAREDVEDGMNLSGGMGLGYVNITTTDLK